MKGLLLKNKVHLLKQMVHCYNYTMQVCGNWPGGLGSCQAKVSLTIKNSDYLSKQEILLLNNAWYCFNKALALLQIEYYIIKQAHKSLSSNLVSN